MEQTVQRNKNPKEKASFISRLLVLWLIPIFKKGVKGTLELNDIYSPLKVDESELAAARLEREWNRELGKLKDLEYSIGKDGKKVLNKSAKEPSLVRALIRTFIWDNIPVMLILLLEGVILRCSMPIFQGQVIIYFNTNSTAGKSEALYHALGLLISTFGISFCMHHYFLYCEQIGNRMRVACSSLIYRKMLRMGKSSLNQTAAGQVVNLLSNDLSRFDICLPFFHYMWCAVFQVAMIVWITWNFAGVAALLGCCSLIIFSLPIYPIVGNLSKSIRNKLAFVTDKRIQFMNELVSGIQVVKMYAWEIPFAKVVSDTRAKEMVHVRSAFYVQAFIKSSVMVMERFALYISMITYSLMGNILNARITFVLASFYNHLQMVTGVFLPQGFVFLGETIVSIKRVKQFLLLDELNFSNVEVLEDPRKSLAKPIILETKIDTENRPVHIKLERVCANWITGQLPPTLYNVSMEVESGQLCAIVGLVGSGKTAILNVLLKELPLGAGMVNLRQNLDLQRKMILSRTAYVVDNPNLTISYASQDAWLFTATIRDNILFGQIFDEERYKKVVEVCALVRDFKQFPYGDKTLVGERGVSLSGGQRARINLARAVYKKADLYLLDDPLSAVDTKVGQHLFQKCIREFLANKTRILVTHQLQFLNEVDKVILVERGTVICQGQYEELKKSNVEFLQILEIMSGKEEKMELDNKAISARVSISDKEGIKRQVSKQDSTLSSQLMNDTDDAVFDPTGKMNEEEMGKGIVKNQVYLEYFRAGGSWFACFLLLFSFVFSQMCNSGNDYWISYWTNAEFIRSKVIHHNQTEYETEYWINNTFFRQFGLDQYGLLPTNSYIYFYTFTITFVIITNYIRSIIFMNIAANASYNLHNSMFDKVLRATMHFFNTNPSGRILNRFSKDIGAMDEMLPRMLLETFQIFFVMIGVLIIVAVVHNWMIIVGIVLLITIYFMRYFFLKTVNPLKRIEGITKSPVFSHVNSTLNGITTIRSGGKLIENMMIKQFDSLQDTHTGANYLILASSAMFCIVIDIFCDIFVSLVTFSFILTKNEETFGGSVGLAISQSLILTSMVQYGVRRSTEVISQFTAVERILQYTKLPQEEPLNTVEPLPKNWPSKGRIIFKNVFMKYNEYDSPVLKDLNVTIEPTWKVGVVGRTGAGKTSLIAAIFRLTGKNLQGIIEIDGRDTATIGLPDLRSRISIIPQEPVLFSASLRYNLDPFSNYSDSELWDVLREVELTDVSLEQQVLEGGNNFSVGQRQLICLARAILRNNKFLVLDEATANIDSYTDALIQKTIRKKFADCTVITVAHRLNTVIDSDRIIVMDAGLIVEFGHPYELLKNKPNGYFTSMINQLDQTTAKELCRLAKIEYYKKNQDTDNSTRL